VRSLAVLQAECARLGITVETKGRQNKEAWIVALQNHYWDQEYPAMPLPPQVQPMLLEDWQRLDHQAAEELESDHCGWIVQPKLDGVRVLLHVEEDGIRITGRSVSDVTYRLTEHQAPAWKKSMALSWMVNWSARGTRSILAQQSASVPCRRQSLSSEPDPKMPEEFRIPMTSAYNFTSSTFSSIWART